MALGLILVLISLMLPVNAILDILGLVLIAIALARLVLGATGHSRYWPPGR
jgi:uncharacterized membrane protein